MSSLDESIRQSIIAKTAHLKAHVADVYAVPAVEYRLLRSDDFPGGSRYSIIISGVSVGWVVRWDRDHHSGWRGMVADRMLGRKDSLGGTKACLGARTRQDAVDHVLFEARYGIPLLMEDC